jgi:glycosyltransferase involved in cell wall biosynthesis
VFAGSQGEINMKISIITVVLNGEKYIQTAIDSVVAQKSSSFEHIVIDGGSKDQTIEILKSNPHVRWISEPDRGPGDASKKGFRMATGDILCLLPADDYFTPNAFDAVTKIFARQADCKWVAGRCSMVDDNGKEVRRFITWYKNLLQGHHSFFLLLTENYLSAQAVFFRKELLSQIGEFDLGSDTEYDLWVRFCESNRLYTIDDTVACFRIHQGTHTTSFKNFPATKAFAAVKRRYFRLHPLAVSLHYLNYLKQIVCYSIINRTLDRRSFSHVAENTSIFKKTRSEIIRYVLGGTSSAVLCFGSLAFFVEIFRINYMVAANISGGLIYLYSYVINKYLVFKKTEKKQLKHASRFILVQVFLWVVSNAVLFCGVDRLKIHYLLMIFFIAAMNAVLNFLIMKFFVFI